MQNKPTLDVMQRAIRKNVCPQCYQREPKGDWPDLGAARPCEAGCPIFVNLTTIKQIAERIDEPSIAPYERAMNELICQTCEISPTGGDYCGDRAVMNCPLSRYSSLVVETLERVSKATSS